MDSRILRIAVDTATDSLMASKASLEMLRNSEINTAIKNNLDTAGAENEQAINDPQISRVLDAITDEITDLTNLKGHLRH